jgi:RimJ/RimL family protein N-acetyltransferase
MQLTSLLSHIDIKQEALTGAWRGYAPASPPRANAIDDRHGSSIAGGLAFQTRDGLIYTLRRVTPADEGLLGEFTRRLSGQARWLRFMTARPCSPEAVRAEVAHMLAGATGNLIALIVTEARGSSAAVVAVAELACDRESGTGEVGLVVSDDAQRTGLGSLLLRQLLLIAQELGLSQLHGDMFAHNYAIQRLIRGLGLPYDATIRAGEMHVVVHVPA